ncbi:hypothetical protein DNH61_24495 [Paenibacillus sambharensis]|uniref:Uncharacterized protein n=1 Tax=Paenibacillus sambharensis TaxID=1803190 RepID=A0A2W1KZU9_9BACL|nr:hypothetical protein [Paenibacillus sambharensis]PZD93208.1 hypothetical protein DNH61_24495 [Paenibacillus sambharensis]
MRKSIFIFVLSSLVLLMSPLTGNAEGKNAGEKKGRILIKNKEIIELKILEERAEKGLTDLVLDEGTSTKTNIVMTSKNGKKMRFKVKKLKTAQLLEKSTSVNGDTVESYAVTSITNYDSDRYDSKNDSSYGIKAYSRIYIDKITYTDVPGTYWKLIKATGGWERNDPILRLANRKVNLGTVGLSRQRIESQQVTYEPTRDTWSYNAPSDWNPVNSQGVNITTPFVGASSTVDIFVSDPDKSWELQFANNFK